MLAGLQIARLGGMAEALQVGGRGHREHARVEQLARHQRGRLRMAEAQRQVEAVGDQVAEILATVQLQLEFGMRVDEGAQARAPQSARTVDRY